MVSEHRSFPVWCFYAALTAYIIAFFLPSASPRGAMRGYECAMAAAEPFLDGSLFRISEWDIKLLIPLVMNLPNGFVQIALLSVLFKFTHRFIGIGLFMGAFSCGYWLVEIQYLLVG